MSYFRDPEFQTKLASFICRDRNFLKECGHLLTADDFKPRKGEGNEIWLLATTALDYWTKYREPIGGMLRTEMLDQARKLRLGDRQKDTLLGVVKDIHSQGALVAADALLDKVIEYKKDRLKAQAVSQLLELQETAQLTDEAWLRVCMEGVEKFSKMQYPAVDYFTGLEDRILRRKNSSYLTKFPLLFIDPLDELIRTIPRGQLALWLAYLKMGKSLALQHTAIAHALQGFDVLYFTLEDPMSEVEDRLDASIVELPMRRLNELPKTLRKRFARFMRLMRSKIHLIDATEGGLTVPRIEELWERERNRGFNADCVIIDYDDEIKPVRKHVGESARRFEFADIYRDLRQFSSRRLLYLWLAAQTSKKAEGKKIITASMTAEDQSKIRKVGLALGIGQGELGDNSRHIYVAAHKHDRQWVGVDIVSDPEKGVFYKREETLRLLALQSRKVRRP